MYGLDLFHVSFRQNQVPFASHYLIAVSIRRLKLSLQIHRVPSKGPGVLGLCRPNHTFAP